MHNTTCFSEIEVVDFGATGIVRCKRCRTYINPYVTWADNGRRWRCNICGMQNDVPSTYFSHLDNNGHRRDRDQRPELSRCSVEFVAPGDYMVRCLCVASFLLLCSAGFFLCNAILSTREDSLLVANVVVHAMFRLDNFDRLY